MKIGKAKQAIEIAERIAAMIQHEAGRKLAERNAETVRSATDDANYWKGYDKGVVDGAATISVNVSELEVNDVISAVFPKETD